MKLTIEITGKKLGDVCVDLDDMMRQLHTEIIYREGDAEYSKTRLLDPITIEQHGGPGMTVCRLSLTN